MRSRRDDIIELLSRAGSLTARQIATRLRMRLGALYVRLSAMQKAGDIERDMAAIELRTELSLDRAVPYRVANSKTKL